MPAMNAAANARPPNSHRVGIRYEIRSIIVVVPLVSVRSVGVAKAILSHHTPSASRMVLSRFKWF